MSKDSMVAILFVLHAPCVASMISLIASLVECPFFAIWFGVAADVPRLALTVLWLLLLLESSLGLTAVLSASSCVRLYSPYRLLLSSVRSCWRVGTSLGGILGPGMPEIVLPCVALALRCIS